MGTQDKEAASLSKFQLVKMSLAGASQAFLWIIQGAYGTPLLLNLGMPKSWTSIVWMAGPISGLFQPLFGAYSDVHKSRFGRRRPFIVAGTLASIASIFIFSYAAEIGNILTLGHGSKGVSLAVAVLSIGTFNLCSCISSAGTRSIVIENTPFHQQKLATAVSSVTTGASAIFMLGMGSVDLPGILGVTWPSAHIKLMSFLASALATLYVTTTCLSIHEAPRPGHSQSGRPSLKSMMARIWQALKIIPVEIQILCAIQFFWSAAMYPVFHYASTWVAQFYTGRHQPFIGDNIDDAQQRGTLGMGLAEGVSLLSTGVALQIVARTKRSLGKPLMLFNYVGAAIVFFVTYFVINDVMALVVLACLGIPAGSGGWVAGALLGEHAVNAEETHNSSLAIDSTASKSGARPRTRASLLRSESLEMSMRSISSSDDSEAQLSFSAPPASDAEDPEPAPDNLMSSGILIGVHTLSGVSGQMVFALVAGSIFRALDSPAPEIPPGGDLPPPEGMVAGDAKDSIGWLFRLSGVLSVIAAFLTVKVREAKSKSSYTELPTTADEEELASSGTAKVRMIFSTLQGHVFGRCYLHIGYGLFLVEAWKCAESADGVAADPRSSSCLDDHADKPSA